LVIFVDCDLQELKEVGGTEELEKEIKKRIKRKGTSDAMQ
jgi:beta-carotene 3-hydroxylase